MEVEVSRDGNIHRQSYSRGIPTSRLEVIGNVVKYDVPNALLDLSGTLKVQAVLQKESGEVWKSTIESYKVNQSINASDDIPNKDDFITNAQKTLDDIENGLTPTIGDNGNWYVGDRDTGKPSRGEQGIQGPKGDAGSIKFIIVNELPTEDIDESAMYLKKLVGEEEQNHYEEYIFTNGEWELVGTAKVEVDLTDYATKTYVDKKLGDIETLLSEV